VFTAIGGLTASLVIAQLVGSITGQSFYPREGTFGMWCAIGLMLRVWIARARTNLSIAMHDRAIDHTPPTHPLEWWRPRPRPTLAPSTRRRETELTSLSSLRRERPGPE
jgi:hypothetical protein